MRNKESCNGREQAEDGIRDPLVTGVQTCALPICLVVLFAAGSMALFGAALAWLMGYPVPTMALATAPAGIAEMVLTGKVLGLDATLIAGFQLMRIIIVLIWCRTALVLFNRAADWAFGKPPGPPLP